MRILIAAILGASASLGATSAFAMAPPADQGSQQGGPLGFVMSILPIAVIFVIFYFLLIRPQQKKAKEHAEMLAGVKKGDKVITSGGIYGLVENVTDNTVTLKVAENTKVKFGKSHIAAIRGAGDED